MFVFDGFRGCIYLKYYGPGQLASFFHFYDEFVSVPIPSAKFFFFQCHHQDSYDFFGNRKKRLNSIEEDKPNKLMLLLGIQDRNDHSKIPQGKMVLWMFDAQKITDRIERWFLIAPLMV